MLPPNGFSDEHRTAVLVGVGKVHGAMVVGFLAVANQFHSPSNFASIFFRIFSPSSTKLSGINGIDPTVKPLCISDTTASHSFSVKIITTILCGLPGVLFIFDAS
jgi:hypothetical protein